MSVQKLKIYAMLMRLQELEKERLLKLELARIKRMEVFKNPPIPIVARPMIEPFKQLYDKKGKLFELPKSKFHR